MNRPVDLIEIDIRGRFMTMACDIEFMLLNIMVYCSPDPYNQIRKFKKMMMSDKIQNTIADLKKYKRKYYKEYKEELEELDEFKIIRNDLAHNRIDWENEQDLTKFKVIFVDDKGGIEGLMFKEYTIEYIKESIEKFRKLELSLASLFYKLRVEINNQP